MRRVFTGGAFTGVAAIIATWIALGLGSGINDTSCPLPAYPSASCTGVPAGTTLTAYTGPADITTPGTVIDGKDVSECLTIKAPDVVIRDSLVHCTNFLTIRVDDDTITGHPLLIEDSEITCNDGPGTAVSFSDYTLRRVNIHGCENATSSGANVDIRNSYIHGLFQDENSHSDGIQFDSLHVENGVEIPGAKNITIVHNTIEARGLDGENGNSAIIANHAPDQDQDVLIQDNLFSGGLYTVFCYEGTAVNFRLIKNHFSTEFGPLVGTFGPSTGCGDETQSGNVIHETGAPLTLG